MSRFWLCTVFGALSLGGFAAVRDDAGVVVRDSNVVVVQAGPRPSASDAKPLDGTAIEYTKSFSVTNAGNTHLVFSSTSRMLFTRCVNNTSGVPVFIVNQGDANTTNGEGPYCDTCAGGAALPPVGDAFLRSSVAGPADVRCGFVESWPSSMSMSSGGGGMSLGAADARYLKLDASNDPVTGKLHLSSTTPLSIGSNAAQSSDFAGGAFVVDNDAFFTTAQLNVHSNDSNPAFLIFSKTRGTHAAPAALQSNDGMGSIFWGGFGTGFSYPMSLIGNTTEAWDGTHHGAKLSLITNKKADAGGNTYTFGDDGSLTSPGPLLLPDGSAGAPSLAFAGLTNTGFFRAGGSGIGVSVGGTERTRMTTTGFFPLTDNTINLGLAATPLGFAQVFAHKILGANAGSDASNDFVQFPRAINAGPVTKPTCATSSDAGKVAYFDDTTDAFKGELCACIAGAGGLYAWLSIQGDKGCDL